MELRLLAATDVDDVTELIADAMTLRFTRVPEPPPEGFAQGWYERYEQGRESRSKEAFAIVGDDGAFRGLALAPAIDDEAAEAEHLKQGRRGDTQLWARPVRRSGAEHAFVVTIVTERAFAPG